jgi:hypothetical protein
MGRDARDPNENTRQAEKPRKDKSDGDVRKFDPTRGADYQVATENGGEARDGVKEDRG